jgi:predicted RNA-binding protein YlxR (DUF448 family)
MRIPQRTCIGCYQTTAKKGLIRIVKCPDGSVVIDPEGNKNGRGTYVCPNEDCINRAIRIDKLNRAFRILPDSINQINLRAVECTKKSLLEVIKR